MILLLRYVAETGKFHPNDAKILCLVHSHVGNAAIG